MFYCKTRYRGNTKRHVISRDTVNRGPVNRGITVYINIYEYTIPTILIIIILYIDVTVSISKLTKSQSLRKP